MSKKAQDRTIEFLPRAATTSLLLGDKISCS